MVLGCFQLSKRKDLLKKNSKLKVVQPCKVSDPLGCIILKHANIFLVFHEDADTPLRNKIIVHNVR